MPSPVSQMTRLYNLLRAAPTLTGWNNVVIKLGSKNMAKTNSAPPRIVLYPKSGEIKVARKHDTALKDADRLVVAHLWGKDFDELEELEARFFQALDFQGVGGYPSNAGAVPGEYFMATAEQWDDDPDSNKQGEELFVALTVVHSIDRIKATTGQVLSTSIAQGATTLTAPMTSNDDHASVASTVGMASSGIASIDAEQIRYTGTTATTLTGLVRGINGTTPSTHSNGATVNVS